MKQFDSFVNDVVSLNEQPVGDPGVAPPPPTDIPVDPQGASPAPGAGEQPDASAAPISPAAEVTLVRLLLKALVINIEDTDLNTLTKIDQPEVTQENAEQVKQDIISIINNQQTRGENESRIETIRDTMNGINENNSKSMLNSFLQLMKQYSDVNIRE